MKTTIYESVPLTSLELNPVSFPDHVAQVGVELPAIAPSLRSAKSAAISESSVSVDAVLAAIVRVNPPTVTVCGAALRVTSEKVTDEVSVTPSDADEAAP